MISLTQAAGQLLFAIIAPMTMLKTVKTKRERLQELQTLRAGLGTQCLADFEGVISSTKKTWMLDV